MMYLTDSTSCPMRHCNKCDMYRKELQKYKETGFTPEEIIDGELLTGWIPVSKRLPNAEEYCKNDGRFILTDGNKVEQGLFDIYADGQHDPYWPYQSCQPIAWMPLPEPYRPED